jgi:peptidoglycan/xylan/chitin deacetylase (PgdA/CDA1 family)
MIKNFLFHRVNPERDKLWDPMDVALFDKCIKFISENYEVDLFENLFENNLLFENKKIATIMFDDGYKDNLIYAAPILKKYNCKASFYIVTDCIDNNIPTWTHILEYQFQNTNISKLNLNFDFLAEEFQIGNLNSLEERIRFVKKLKPFLKKLSDEKRNLVLQKISETYYDTKIPELMMDWDDVRELRNQGHYIGSHTVTHCMLGTMKDESEIRKELINSANRIKSELGYFPLTISYPIGSFNDTTKRISKEVGYKIGLAVGQDVFRPKNDDIFEVKRIELYNESWFKTRLRISNQLENIKSLIGYKK